MFYASSETCLKWSRISPISTIPDMWHSMSELEVLFFNGLFFLLHISKRVYYPKLLDDIQYNNQWTSSSFKKRSSSSQDNKIISSHELDNFQQVSVSLQDTKNMILLIVTFSFFVQKIIFQTRRDNHIMDDTALSKEVVHKWCHILRAVKDFIIQS